MKKYILLLTLLGNLGIAQDHAIIIGCCSEYMPSEVRALKGTSNDAMHMRDILLDRGVQSQNIDYLVEKNATYKNITQKLKAKETSNLKKGDTLYVYYSGHGTSTGDNSAFGKSLRDNPNILERINNSAGLITYDFDLDNPEDTLIISSRDFKPTFKVLDNKGINIILMADACYVGNLTRSPGLSKEAEKSKYFSLNKKRESKESINKINNFYKIRNNTVYKNLIFYGASLTANMAEEDLEKSRGKFSIALEGCMKKRYEGNYITNKNLKECLTRDYVPFAHSSSTYPIDSSLDNNIVIKAPQISSYRPPIFKEFRDKLFNLKSKHSPLKLKLSSTYDSSLAISILCKGESFEIKTTNKSDNEYVIAFTMDVRNRVIMLVPNSKTNEFSQTNNLVDGNTTEPFGRDKIKVFTTVDRYLYEKISKYVNDYGG